MVSLQVFPSRIMAENTNTLSKTPRPWWNTWEIQYKGTFCRKEDHRIKLNDEFIEKIVAKFWQDIEIDDKYEFFIFKLSPSSSKISDLESRAKIIIWFYWNFKFNHDDLRFSRWIHRFFGKWHPSSW